MAFPKRADFVAVGAYIEAISAHSREQQALLEVLLGMFRATREGEVHEPFLGANSDAEMRHIDYPPRTDEDGPDWEERRIVPRLDCIAANLVNHDLRPIALSYGRVVPDDASGEPSHVIVVECARAAEALAA